MNIKLKQYKHVKEEIQSLVFELPEVPVYYFETGVRRSIRIVPVFTTWKMENDVPEELYALEITCVYDSGECKVEKFHISVSDIESMYFAIKHNNVSQFIKDWVDNNFSKRTEERFYADLEEVLRKLR
jgi:hypothetical protein